VDGDRGLGGRTLSLLPTRLLKLEKRKRKEGDTWFDEEGDAPRLGALRLAKRGEGGGLSYVVICCFGFLLRFLLQWGLGAGGILGGGGSYPGGGRR
jgi:hypothetical protein